MKRMQWIWPAVLAIAWTAGTADSSFKITGVRAKQHIKALASDEMRGRQTGTPDELRAADYVAEQMKKLGAKPIGEGGGYYQPLTVPLVRNVPPIRFGIENAEPARYGPDFCTLQYTGSGKVSGEVVFVGYGISDAAKNLDEYAGIDVKGKIVMAIRRGPNDAESWGSDGFIGYKSKTASEKGAVGFILVERQGAQGETTPVGGTIQADYYVANMPSICISSQMADTILKPTGQSVRALQQQIDTGAKPASIATGTTVHMEVHGTYEKDAPTKNILGIIPGSDPKLKNEYIVLSAHLDHVGEGAGGEIFHGADDNASGVGAVLEVLEAMTKNRAKPKRSIIFAAWTGEEIGLVGARYWLDHPTVPLDKVVCDFQLDMVGRGRTELTVAGARSFPDLWTRIKANPKVSMQGARESHAGGGSDHAVFVEKKIPGFMIMAIGNHPNYHQPDDTWDKMQLEVLAYCTQFTYNVVLSAANDPDIAPSRTGEKPATGETGQD